MNTKQNVGLKRNVIDKFYTKKNVVNFCIEQVKKCVQINKNDDLIIEPSAGNGAFIEHIKSLCNYYKFYDLEPENTLIEKQNYLNFKYKKLKFTPKNRPHIHVIGNPPFGRQSSMAMKFIKYSAKFCDSISFILPKSFKKDSMKDKIPLKFHLDDRCWDLEPNSFLINNTQEHNVHCVFQIWIKKNMDRKKSKKLKPKNYVFVKKEDNHDISFRRVGVNAGNIAKSSDSNKKSPQSHYFIKFNNGLFNNKIFDKLGNITFESSNNTVGSKSISKQELIKKYNKI